MTGIRTTALRAITELTQSLAENAPLVAQGEPEALHDVRVAVRRLRSILRAAGPAFQGGEAVRLEARLQELGRGLGTARDREVLAAELRRRAAASLPGVLEGAADAAARRLRSARSEALAELSSPGFQALLAELRAFAEDPPLSGKKLHADDILERDLRRVRRRARRAGEPGLDPQDREALRHEVRKAAKRLRYDATAFGDGDEASRLRDTGEKVQNALGDRRDALALVELLAAEELRSRGRWREELGRLRRAEEERAAAALSAYEEALAELLDEVH